jgi:hypothetical protein
LRDLPEYLRAFWAYVSTGLGLIRALAIVLVWLAGMFAPVAIRTFAEFPNWIGLTWMLAYSLLSFVFAPYGMWKRERAQMSGFKQPDSE